ncbi:MAG: hypothetical protein HKL85_06200 [Acidimicrobiaceae bacterium]|nr:hypothetical protein [Acidimicrobiaceae bacterium]
MALELASPGVSPSLPDARDRVVRAEVSLDDSRAAPAGPAPLGALDSGHYV